MIITQYNSIKFRWLSFVAICCVVAGHSFLREDRAFGFVIPVFAQWHVPWFFFLSGLLLYYSFERQSCKVVMQKKIKGLLIPYILWSLIGFMISGRCCETGLNLDGILGITTAYPHGNPYLWYLHALISFSLVSVVLWMCSGNVSKGKRLFLFSLLYIVIYGLALFVHLGTLYGTPASPFYFLLGFALAHRILKENPGNSARSLLCFVIITFGAIALRVLWFVLGLDGMMECCLRMLCVVLQIGAIWFGYDVIAARWYKIDFPRYLTPIFFVYCFHGLIITIIKKVWLQCCGDSPLSCNVGVPFICVFTLLLSFVGANLLRWSMPRVYNILTGGR